MSDQIIAWTYCRKYLLHMLWNCSCQNMFHGSACLDMHVLQVCLNICIFLFTFNYSSVTVCWSSRDLHYHCSFWKEHDVMIFSMVFTFSLLCAFFAYPNPFIFSKKKNDVASYFFKDCRLNKKPTRFIYFFVCRCYKGSRPLCCTRKLESSFE